MRSFPRRPTFYTVPHFGLLSYVPDVDSHTLQECDFGKYILRSETMLERTPLLPYADRSLHELPIFMRMCHSPWNFFDQKCLILVRGIITLYMTAVLALGVIHRWTTSSTGYMFVFDARYISFFVQVAFYWITAVRLNMSKATELCF